MCDSMKLVVLFIGGVSRGIIGEMQCDFFPIYAPTPYSTVFLLHVPAPALIPIKIGFGAVWCGAV